jgi:aminoglycoside phosphotransferase (APT) family kinase protein
MIVDWGPASCGPPPADVAWTYLLFTIAGVPVGASAAMRLTILALRGLALRIYLRTYFKRTGLAWRDVEQWLGVISILRLGDGIPEERDALLALVRKHLGEPA